MMVCSAAVVKFDTILDGDCHDQDFFFFFYILRRMGRNKAQAHHASTYFHTRRVSI